MSKWLEKNDLIKLVTSQYLPIVFYSSPLWTGCLDSNSWKRLNSAHYRAIRAALHIPTYLKKPRTEIDEISGRATPAQWARYSLASTVITLYTSSDTNIAIHLRQSAYVNDRMPFRAKFIDYSRLKIGRQSLPNRIGPLFSKISFNWMTPMSKDLLRINLKSEFFTSNFTQPQWQ